MKSKLLDACIAAQKAEKAAQAKHDALETEGSGEEYSRAFEALADARANLQAAEEAYDAAVKDD